MKKLFLLFLLSMILTSYGCTGSSNVQPTPTPDTSVGSIQVLDTSRRTAIQDSLKKDMELATMNITVEVKNYDVTLKGQVNTEEQKQRAETITKKIPGVNKINNLIEIVP